MPKSALARTVFAATLTLWTAGLLLALVEIGNDRLHRTILASAIAATLWLLSLCLVSQMKTNVYHFDRGYDIGARAVVHGLMDAADQNAHADTPSRGIRYN
ncbi:hypothetical protein [Microbispora rosea]